MAVLTWSHSDVQSSQAKMPGILFWRRIYGGPVKMFCSALVLRSRLHGPARTCTQIAGYFQYSNTDKDCNLANLVHVTYG